MGEEEEEREDVTLTEGRYIRLPLKLLWVTFIVVIGAVGTTVWNYAGLIYKIEDDHRTIMQTSTIVTEDHKTIQDMHESIMQLTNFANRSESMYNKYFRSYNDPDYKGEKGR